MWPCNNFRSLPCSSSSSITNRSLLLEKNKKSVKITTIEGGEVVEGNDRKPSVASYNTKSSLTTD